MNEDQAWAFAVCLTAVAFLIPLVVFSIRDWWQNEIHWWQKKEVN